MIVTKDRVVSLTYELRLDQPDGEIVESLSADAPLTFLYGGGGLLPFATSSTSSAYQVVVSSLAVPAHCIPKAI